MRGYLKRVFFLLLISELLVMANLPPALSQEGEPLLQKARGTIESVDLKKSTIVIKRLQDEASQAYEKMTVYVDGSAPIKKDFEGVTLSGLAVGDEVNVGYVLNEKKVNIARYISVIPTE